MGIKVDFSEFEAGLRAVCENAIPEAAGRGLESATNRLLDDAIEEKPRAPFDEGHLRGSARTTKAKFTAGKIEAECGFNIEYAARWHEISPEKEKRINWTLPGSGRKYLESKLARNMKKYIALVAEEIKRTLS